MHCAGLEGDVLLLGSQAIVSTLSKVSVPQRINLSVESVVPMDTCLDTQCTHGWYDRTGCI